MTTAATPHPEVTNKIDPNCVIWQQLAIPGGEGALQQPVVAPLSRKAFVFSSADYFSWYY